MNYLARFIESKRILEKLQGFVRTDVNRWRDKYYDAEITNIPTYDAFPSARPAFMIRYHLR